MTDSYDNELIERMERILTATANALHGGYAPPDCLHSWHDLPELVEKLRKERDEARRQYCRGFTDFCPDPALDHLTLEEAAVEVAKSFGWDCFKENDND